jgi:hypothetical protein
MEDALEYESLDPGLHIPNLTPAHTVPEDLLEAQQGSSAALSPPVWIESAGCSSTMATPGHSPY